MGRQLTKVGRTARWGVPALAATVAAASIAAADGPGASAAQRGTEVIRTTGETTETNSLDHGRSGPSLGDQIINTDTISRGGRRIGQASYVCTLVSMPATYSCEGVFVLPRGHLGLQGLVNFELAGQGRPFRGILTGGTRRYRNARGEVTTRLLSQTTQERVFRISTR